MTDLETRLRDALRSTPMPPTQPGSSDAVSNIERRVNRARALITGGAVAVLLAVAAAIVVPLQLTRGDGDAKVTGRPSPSPTVTGTAATPWPAQGSVALTAGGGSLWSLRPDPGSSRGGLNVDRLDPRTHAHLGRWSVAAPATWLFYGLDRVWLTGGGDGAYPDGVLQVLNPSTGSVRTLTSVHQQLSGVGFAHGHAWVLAGRTVWEVDASGRHIGSVTLPVVAAQLGIVGTDSGELWVAAQKSWLQIDPVSRRVVDTVRFQGPMLGADGRAAIWTYEAGRLVSLSPSLLHQGQSVAEGARVPVPGAVSEVAPSRDGGLFIVAADGPDPGSSSSTLYYLSAAQLAAGAGIDDHTPSAPGGAELAPDGTGGVNYLSDQGGMHWSP